VVHDNSLNGTFVNDVKIDGSAELHDGDIITFGGGSQIKAGTVLRQPESEFVYLFESIEDVQFSLFISLSSNKTMKNLKFE